MSNLIISNILVIWLHGCHVSFYEGGCMLRISHISSTVGWILAPIHTQILVLQTLKVTFYGKWDFVGMIKDLEMGRLFWIIKVGLNAIPSVLIRGRKREKWHRRRGSDVTAGEEIRWHGHQSRTVSSHQKLKGQREMDSPWEPPKGALPCWHVDSAVQDSTWAVGH